MKSSVLRTLVTLGLGTIFNHVGLLAQDQILCANVPFDFTVGANSFSAGKFCVQRWREPVVRIQDSSHGTGIFAQTLPANPTKEPGKVKFTFHRYGSTYFLAQVSDNNIGRAFFRSTAEKELIAKALSLELVVMASK
jgi:hypothetical protein